MTTISNSDMPVIAYKFKNPILSSPYGVQTDLDFWDDYDFESVKKLIEKMISLDVLFYGDVKVALKLTPINEYQAQVTIFDLPSDTATHHIGIHRVISLIATMEIEPLYRLGDHCLIPSQKKTNKPDKTIKRVATVQTGLLGDEIIAIDYVFNGITLASENLGKTEKNNNSNHVQLGLFG